MPKLIQLKLYDDGRSIWVNPDKVCYLYPMGSHVLEDEREYDGTWLQCEGCAQHVQGHPDEIAPKLGFSTWDGRVAECERCHHTQELHPAGLCKLCLSIWEDREE